MRYWMLGMCLIGSFAQPALSAVSSPAVMAPASERFAKEGDEIPHFQRHVLPVMGRLGCNGRSCHGSFQGQGGFRLSLFGYDFKMDHDALVAGDAPRVDLKEPRKSLMIDKASSDEVDYHGGGKRMAVDSWEYRLLHRWVANGAKSVNENADPTFVRLEVTPVEIVFGKEQETATLKVLSHWSDGSIEDVTCLCRFLTNDDAIAKVDVSGKITIIGKGDTHIVAFYDNGVVPVSVLLPVSQQTGPKYPAIKTPTKIDELVVSKLRKLGVVPAENCTDGEFLRRASLDITGTLPTQEEVTTFLADRAADKRSRKVDELLTRPAYAAWWGTKLCDILGNSENQLRNNYGAGDPTEQSYRWVTKRLSENVPYDQLIEGIVLAKSRTSEDQSYLDYCKMTGNFARDDAKYADRPDLPWYWARQNMRKPNEKALSFSYAFLGVRLQCAECHKHPFDQWSQQDFQQFTAFFNRVNYGVTDQQENKRLLTELGITKEMNNGAKNRIFNDAAKAGKLVPYSEVHITNAKKFAGPDRQKAKAASGTRVITPKVLGGEEVVDADFSDPRQPLMDWLRDQDNPYFARAIVNRVWANYFNVGIVEPADDMNLANAPSNRELLDWLARAFIDHKYDLKWLHRTIVASDTYQRSWQTNTTNEFDLRNFSHTIPRRLPAEVVYDAVISASAGGAELARRREDPITECAIGISPGYSRRVGAGNYALGVFGKPKRETPCDCERSNEPSLLQTVYLRNDSELFTLIERNNGWLSEATRLLKKAPTAAEEKTRVEGRIRDLERSLVKAKSQEKKKGDVKDIQNSLKDLRAQRARFDTPSKPNTTEPMTIALAVEQAYLRTFGRRPLTSELAEAEKYVSESADAITGLKDLMWALINSKEFLVNH